MKKTTIVVIVLVILIAIVALFFVMKKQETKTTEAPKVNVNADSLGGTLSSGVGDVQPLEKIPNVNVFNSVETNPYKSGYTNPFAK